MAPIFWQLQPVVINDNASFYDQNTKNWTFNQKKGQKNPVFPRQLINNADSLNIEYSVLCTQLVNATTITIQQVERALQLADLLEFIYRYHLIVPREVIRIRRDQDIYREILRLNADYSNRVIAGTFVSKTVRDLTASVNWPRLSLLRIRRLLLTVGPLTNNPSGYRQFLGGMERYVGPAVPYISWIFFVPRLFTNLFLIAKHVIPGSWMGEQERNLGWQTRLNAQLQRRWFELANDSVWLTAGLINCFLLIGALGPIGLIVGAACQGFDAILAGIRAHVELKRLDKIKEKYICMLKDPAIDPYEQKQMEDYLTHLKQRITHEKKRLYLSVGHNLVLLLAVILILPIFAGFPAIPLVGAIIALLLNTLVFYALTKYLERHKPSDKIQKESLLAKCSFFNNPSSSKPSSDIDVDADESRPRNP